MLQGTPCRGPAVRGKWGADSCASTRALWHHPGGMWQQCASLELGPPLLSHHVHVSRGKSRCAACPSNVLPPPPALIPLTHPHCLRTSHDTDRFATDLCYGQPAPEASTYMGGTWAGMRKQRNYIQALGFDAVWLSPVTAQGPDAFGSSESRRTCVPTSLPALLCVNHQNHKSLG